MLAHNTITPDEVRILLERAGARIGSIAQKYPGGKIAVFFWIGKSPRVWVLRSRARFENFALDIEREFGIIRSAA